jgi:glycosyltransferase involved in cell wall biosynthesis
VTTVHGLNSPGRYSAIMTTGERVICVSTTVRDFLRKHYPDVDPQRLRVIPRGIDPQAFPHGHKPDAAWRARFAAEFPMLAGRPLLVLSGRGSRLKNHAHAVRALALLSTRYGIDAGLFMPGAREAGRDAYLADMTELAVELGVADRVVATRPRDDVRDVYAAAQVMLQVSRKPESFGRTALEALSLGVPVVGYAHGGVGELLTQWFPAGAVAVGDVDALADRIAAVLRSPTVPGPVTGYALSDMQADTLALYRELVDAPVPA